MSKYKLEQAEKDLFAVYQVIYADADIEMWYDWNTRLNDTTFTDQCFWLIYNNEKIGGAIINNQTVMFPFLIAPFSDRTVFWKALSSCCNDIRHINGVLQKDIDILLTLGYSIDVTRQVMCCPADASITAKLPAGFTLQVLNKEFDRKKIAEVMMEGYKGGIDYKVYGTPDEDEVLKDVEYLLKVYQYRNLSIVLLDEEQEIAGLCIAGISKNMPLGFAEIGDMCVVPKHRNKRLAEYMLKYIRASASEHTKVVKLCVTVGNHAEALYRKVGFYPGPRFSNMSKGI
ncbi:GNAT family N-acetyltransferase [Bacillus sp. SD088]|uniref:GNAT family N-acetyltransferase n=1 Tax=Bacillus sp. SD088 TaxID=2782012 RepID=UPI001A9666DC|nr:GNAT family N-acetyltransferase [Bacillus sp. SD088]MBO0992801.1 GNAT family N-acetyltransferase [Bacillus sp. SD088]